jgi:predicted transcriptional regulator
MTKGHRKGPARRKSTRLTITFPREQYDLLERIAKDKKVSVAWVTRDAVEKYLAEQWPLFSQGREEG